MNIAVPDFPRSNLWELAPYPGERILWVWGAGIYRLKLKDNGASFCGKVLPSRIWLAVVVKRGDERPEVVLVRVKGGQPVFHFSAEIEFLESRDGNAPMISGRSADRFTAWFSSREFPRVRPESLTIPKWEVERSETLASFGPVTLSEFRCHGKPLLYGVEGPQNVRLFAMDLSTGLVLFHTVVETNLSSLLEGGELLHLPQRPLALERQGHEARSPSTRTPVTRRTESYGLYGRVAPFGESPRSWGGRRRSRRLRL